MSITRTRDISSSADELLAPYQSKILILNVTWTTRPLFGRLIRYDNKYLVLEKKTGNLQTIRRDAVLCIDEVV